MDKDVIYKVAKAWIDKEHVDSAVDWVKLMADDLARRFEIELNHSQPKGKSRGVDARCAYCEDVYGNGDDFNYYEDKPACDKCYIGLMEEAIKDSVSIIKETDDKHYTMNEIKGELLENLDNLLD